MSSAPAVDTCQVPRKLLETLVEIACDTLGTPLPKIPPRQTHVAVRLAGEILDGVPRTYSLEWVYDEDEDGMPIVECEKDGKCHKSAPAAERVGAEGGYKEDSI